LVLLLFALICEISGNNPIYCQFLFDPMAEAFISYRHILPDQDLAGELTRSLHNQGIPCFQDTGIKLGENWIQTIESELRACRFLVVLLSAESILSDFLRLEVKRAHEWNKRILPIRVNYDGALPYDLASYLDHIQYKIWKTSEPFEPICGAVLDGIRGGWKDDGLNSSPEALRQLGEITELNGAPLPSADPRLEIGGPETGGLKLGSRFYVRRADDKTVERLVQQPGETILIKGPRQVGKTSLAARACAVAERAGQRVCYIDLQLLDQSRLRDLGALCRYLASRLAKDFRVATKPADVWDEQLGDTDSLTDFIEQAVLSAGAPMVLCLDEVDHVFTHDYRVMISSACCAAGTTGARFAISGTSSTC
jgi:AAA-like domain/TIR domain